LLPRRALARSELDAPELEQMFGLHEGHARVAGRQRGICVGLG
jgi:hypothetical protein